MATLGEINVRIGAKIDKMVGGLKSAEKSLIRSGRKFKRLGNDLTTTVSLPLIGIGLAGGKMAAQLETSFSKIENLVGVSGATLEDFKKEVASISGVVGKSQKELSDALFTITSAGLKGEAALELLNSASKASVIGLGDTGTVAKAATAIMTAFADRNYTAAEAVNLLAKTVREGNLAAEELAPAIGKVLPIAAQLGVSFEEVGANIATFSRLGISAGESVTALKAFLGNLIKPSKEAEKILKKFGLTAQGVRDSISKNGLSATLKDLLKRFDGNTESVAKLFGSVEGLANVLGTAGAQGEEYTRILATMSDGIDIVETGFEKASETADQKFNKSLVRLQNRSIKIGAIVLPIFNKIVDIVSDWAERFARLDDSTQKTIIKIAALAAAVGPLLRVYGAYQTTLAAVKAAQIALSLNIKSLAGSLLTAAARFSALNNVMKSSVIGVVVTAAVAAVAIFRQYSRTIDETSAAQKAHFEISNTAQKNIVEEKIKVQNLIDVLKNETSSRAEKAKALKELNRISPKYFGGFDVEKFKLENVIQSQNAYIANILQMAKVQAAKDRIVELNKALFDTAKLNEVAAERTGGFFNTLTNLSLSAEGRAKRENAIANKRVDNYKDGINKQIEALSNFLATESKLLSSRPTNNTFTGSTNAETIVFDAEVKKVKTDGIKVPPLALSFEKIDSVDLELIRFDEMGVMTAINNINDSTGFLKQNFDSLGVSGAGVVSSMSQYAEALPTGATQMFTSVIAQMNRQLEAAQELAISVAAALSDYAKQGGKSLKELGKTALKAAADFVRAQLMQAIASFIAKSLATLGPAGLLVAGAGSAIVGTLFNKALTSLKIPALAEGGLAYGPTLALVGDNKGASSDPEVIAPLSKLSKIMGGMGGSSNINLTGQFEIAGDKLILLLENAKKQQIRTRGY